MPDQSRRLLLEMNTACNLDCRYCFHHGRKRKHCKNPTVFELPEIILRDLGITEVTLTGGEPLLDYQALLSLIQYFSKLGLTTELVTNGTLITEEIIDTMESTGLERIAVSLDTLESPTHRALRGIPVEPILEAIDTIQNHSNLYLEVVVVLSVLNANIEGVQRLFEFAEIRGIDAVHVHPATLTHLPPDERGIFAVPRLYELLLQIQGLGSPLLQNRSEFFRLAERLQNREFVEPFTCDIGSRLLYISVDGLLGPCPIRTDLLRQEAEECLELVENDHLECRLQRHCLCLF